jgi:formyl-CoA transferase
MLFDEHVLEEGLVVNVDHPVVGRYRALGPALRMSRSTGRADAPSPLFAEHTEAVLSELGYSSEQISLLCETGAVASSGEEHGSGTPSSS